jgi:hypothetical protein
VSNALYFTNPATPQTVTGDCPNIASGNNVQGESPTFEATLTNTTSLSATVLIYGSVMGLGWTLLGTITLNGALATDSFTPQFSINYTQYKANVQAISGTLAGVSVAVGW